MVRMRMVMNVLFSHRYFAIYRIHAKYQPGPSPYAVSTDSLKEVYCFHLSYTCRLELVVVAVMVFKKIVPKSIYTAFPGSLLCRGIIVQLK